MRASERRSPAAMVGGKAASNRARASAKARKKARPVPRPASASLMRSASATRLSIGPRTRARQARPTRDGLDGERKRALVGVEGDRGAELASPRQPLGESGGGGRRVLGFDAVPRESVRVSDPRRTPPRFRPGPARRLQRLPPRLVAPGRDEQGEVLDLP